jgi:phospholipase/carboxylesterase
VLLLHGWTGDEQSMSIFASRLSKDYLMISPRGLYLSQAGGFSWSARTEPGWSGIDDFRSAGQALIDFVTLQRFPQADLSRVILIGFSQGAALAFSMLLLFPERIYSIAAISGFLPSGAERYLQSDPLKGKTIFVAHGTNDGIVPIEASQQAVEALEKTGVQVAYCEEDVGHKLSANCFRSLDTFIDSII